MTGLLKNAVVVLVLITAAKRIIAADDELGYTATEAPTADGQENTTSAVKEASQEPEETTRRDAKSAGIYPAELCNPFYQFWTEHCDVWTVRSTDEYTGQCKRQRPRGINNTGVLLNTSEINVFTQKFRSVDMFWKFEDDNSTSFKESDLGEYRDYLLYQNVNKTCAVVRRDWFWYHTEEQKKEYEKEVDKKKQNYSTDIDWARCLSTSRTGQPICTSRPTYDLLLENGHQDNVTDECMKKYEDLRDKIKSDKVKYNATCKSYFAEEE